MATEKTGRWVSAQEYLDNLSQQQIEEAAKRDLDIAAIRRMYEAAQNYDIHNYKYYQEEREKQERLRRVRVKFLRKDDR